jgi:hypothetical protein
MPSHNFKYLGNNCGTIHSLGIVYGGGKTTPADIAFSQGIIATGIKDNPDLGLIAITADYWQTHIHQILKDNGFRAITRFKSSHDSPLENLTLWARDGKKVPVDKNRVVEVGPLNCSVGYNKASGSRMLIRTQKAKGFKKIKGLNAWYKIAAKHLVKIKD